MTDCGIITRALASYDPDAQEANIVKAEDQRARLLALFPRQGWPEMTLQRYALGQANQPDNFGRWMEFVTVDFSSMRGGNARKHLIYYEAGTGDWWYNRKAYGNVEEAWQAVRQGFVDAIAFAEAGDWGAIEDIAAIHSGPALVTKTLSMYFPSELLPINSQAHLRHFLQALGDESAGDQSLGTTRLNRLLLKDLRSCPDLDGWTTKQMERLLYSELGPRPPTPAEGSIENIASFVASVLTEVDGRLELRRQAEDEARKLLNDFAGSMTEIQVRTLFKLFNADFDGGKRTQTRFSPAFVGQTANALVTDLLAFNSWTGRVWHGSDDEAAAAISELLSDRKALPSAGTAYPTMLMYLRSPDTSSVWLRSTDRGLQRLTSYKPTKSLSQGGFEDYMLFCEAATVFMADYDLPPELLDFVLAAAARADQPRVEVASSSGVWLFQANPTIYDINRALSELPETDWTVRQYTHDVKKGDLVYLWRSGPDAGVIGTATVLTDPAVLPGDANDQYVLQPGALTKPEPRVMLRIDSVLPAVIRRSDLIEHPVLKDLGVIRFANATNFKISPEQNQALQTLLSGFRVPPVRAELEDRVHIPQRWLQEALDLLTEKGQVVFYGPPGTGKTFVALALAEEITRDGGAFRIVQFHPSYSYEDFVGGFRPVEDDAAYGVKYRRTNGPLRDLVGEAENDPGHPYVLIVDEINRGNIPKIFGELLFLLEYRQKAIRLQYWPEYEFSLPRNLFLIGTMNTADRSIALVDAALRRRFYFVPFMPTTFPINEVLPKWLEKNGHGDEAARLLELLNREIAHDEIAIGPSYFMTDPAAGPELDRIWAKAIIPLLEEYYYASDWDPNKFSLAKLRARLRREPSEMANEGEEQLEDLT
jgi:MoxR-like ATPase